MSIVTFGVDTTKEVEGYLGFNQPIDRTDAVGVEVNLLILSVEGWLRLVTGRNFEEQTYTKEIHDVEPFQSIVFLSDQPVTTFTLLEKVTDRDSAGVVTLETIDADEYVVTRNRVEALGHHFPAGLQNIRATYTAGYTTAQITNTSSDEVAMWKALELSIIAREWGLAKENKRHIRNINFGDESETFNFDLDQWQRRLLYMLKLERNL